jgi:hypothetical protein
MVRRSDRPLRIVRVSFETTRFSVQHLIEAYTALVPEVRRQHLRAPRAKTGPSEVSVTSAKRRRGEA